MSEISFEREYAELDKHVRAALKSIPKRRRDSFSMTDDAIIYEIVSLVKDVFIKFRAEFPFGRFNDSAIKFSPPFTLAVDILEKMFKARGYPSLVYDYDDRTFKKGANLARDILYYRFRRNGQELHREILDEILTGRLDKYTAKHIQTDPRYLLYLPAAIITMTILEPPEITPEEVINLFMETEQPLEETDGGVK